MKKKQIIGMVIAAVLFIGVGASSVLVNSYSQKTLTSNVEKSLNVLTSEEEFSPPESDYIALVEVTGTIQEQSASDVWNEAEVGYRHNDTLEYIDQLIADKNNKAILLYVDSPGGAVYESEELYLKLMEYKEKTNRPIWDYMAHYAASGGYMISMPSDKIYANPNTVTGSIGVIMSGFDMSGLYEKLGIRYISITSGKNKDSSQMTEEQMSIYQTQVDECYESFVEKVANGRNMSEKDVKKLADGRTYTAKQAKENGLIDEIALYDDVKNIMSKELDVDEFYAPEKKTNVFSQLFQGISKMIPKSEAQVLKETADETESGVLLYYAEQLR